MGQLLNGKWTDDQPFTPGPHKFELGSPEFPFDKSTPKGRYHLYVGHACPFAHRALSALYLSGLDEVVDTSFVYPENTPEGWSFESHGLAGIGDNFGHKKLLHEVYTAADSKYTGRVTIPLLVDTQPSSDAGGDGKIRIVSNESIDLVKQFAKLSRNPNLEAGVEAGASEELSKLVYGFPGIAGKNARETKEDVYEKNTADFFHALGQLDAALGEHAYLAGAKLSILELLLLPFLLRLEIGNLYFYKLTIKRIKDFPHLDKYVRKLYQTPQLKRSIDITQAHQAIFSEHARNKFAPSPLLVPVVPALDWDVPLKE